jgi:hypothetical protein
MTRFESRSPLPAANWIVFCMCCCACMLAYYLRVWALHRQPLVLQSIEVLCSTSLGGTHCPCLFDSPLGLKPRCSAVRDPRDLDVPRPLEPMRSVSAGDWAPIRTCKTWVRNWRKEGQWHGEQQRSNPMESPWTRPGMAIVIDMSILRKAQEPRSCRS